MDFVNGVQIIRTPDDRFINLPGYDFKPHYVENLKGYEGIRVYLCIHGDPTWSYLYRKMIPVFVKAGKRVIAPDLIGFGRSDKFVQEKDYTFHMHREMLLSLIRYLDIKNITLVCQDWGGLLGLTLPVGEPSRFKQLLVMNTGFGVGHVPDTWYAWRNFCRRNPDLPIGKVIQKACPHLTHQEIQAYDAPHPTALYKVGPRIFPELVPTDTTFPGVVYMAIGMKDPVIGVAPMHSMSKIFPGKIFVEEVEEAGHFVQEWVKPKKAKDFPFNKYILHNNENNQGERQMLHNSTYGPSSTWGEGQAKRFISRLGRATEARTHERRSNLSKTVDICRPSSMRHSREAAE
ncbi:haloalkane dehalogenase, partial [Planoprotostelium fungivorum]